MIPLIAAVDTSACRIDNFDHGRSHAVTMIVEPERTRS